MTMFSGLSRSYAVAAATPDFGLPMSKSITRNAHTPKRRGPREDAAV